MSNKNNNNDNKSSSLFFIEPSKVLSDDPTETVSFKIWKKKDFGQKTEEAMNKAMNTIQNVAKRVNSTINSINENDKPDNVEVEFGLKFDGELDVVIAKAGVEASISVTLNWGRKE